LDAIQATPELVNDPEAFARFQQAQAGLSSALSRLLVVAENYPQLKADAAFRDLQAQLEGTENRITVARNRYIKSVESYNVSVRTFPEQSHGDDLRLHGQAEFQCREREGDLDGAEG
jgi:LemA protein